MAAYIFLIALAVLLASAGIAAYFDLLPDTRDPEYGVGPVLHPRCFKAPATSDR
jgi:hypothetical protein